MIIQENMLVLEDLKRIVDKPNFFSFCRYFVTNCGFTSVVLFRVANFFYRKRIPIVPGFLTHIIRILFSIEIEYPAQIGPGFGIRHGFGIIIGGKCKIGKNFSVNQGVTVGGSFDKVCMLPNGKKISQPQIGDDVHLSAGAKVIGPIIIGSNVIVGANAVVVKDVPDNVVVAGVPAKIIRDLPEI